MRNPHKTTSIRRIQRPLVCAVHRHDADAVKQLVEGSSAPDIGLALHTAYYCNNLACLEILAPYAAVEHNSWVLICAASQGHIEAIRIVMPFADPTTSKETWMLTTPWRRAR